MSVRNPLPLPPHAPPQTTPSPRPSEPHYRASAAIDQVLNSSTPHPPAIDGEQARIWGRQGGLIAGSGRPKAKTLLLRERMKKYVESGEATRDFEKLRKKDKKWAIETSLDRTYGKPTQHSTTSAGVELTPELRASIMVALNIHVESTQGGAIVAVGQGNAPQVIDIPSESGVMSDNCDSVKSVERSNEAHHEAHPVGQEPLGGG